MALPLLMRVVDVFRLHRIAHNFGCWTKRRTPHADRRAHYSGSPAEAYVQGSFSTQSVVQSQTLNPGVGMDLEFANNG